LVRVPLLYYSQMWSCLSFSFKGHSSPTTVFLFLWCFASFCGFPPRGGESNIRFHTSRMRVFLLLFFFLPPLVILLVLKQSQSCVPLFFLIELSNFQSYHRFRRSCFFFFFFSPLTKRFVILFGFLRVACLSLSPVCFDQYAPPIKRFLLRGLANLSYRARGMIFQCTLSPPSPSFSIVVLQHQPSPEAPRIPLPQLRVLELIPSLLLFPLEYLPPPNTLSSHCSPPHGHWCFWCTSTKIMGVR